MQLITDLAQSKLKGNHKVIGRLVVYFNRHYRSIELWIDSRDIRLTLPRAIEIIKEETGLTESEILTEELERATG